MLLRLIKVIKSTLNLHNFPNPKGRPKSLDLKHGTFLWLIRGTHWSAANEIDREREREKISHSKRMNCEIKQRNQQHVLRGSNFAHVFIAAFLH